MKGVSIFVQLQKHPYMLILVGYRLKDRMEATQNLKYNRQTTDRQRKEPFLTNIHLSLVDLREREETKNQTEREKLVPTGQT